MTKILVIKYDKSAIFICILLLDLKLSIFKGLNFIWNRMTCWNSLGSQIKILASFFNKIRKKLGVIILASSEPILLSWFHFLVNQFLASSSSFFFVISHSSLWPISLSASSASQTLNTASFSSRHSSYWSKLLNTDMHSSYPWSPFLMQVSCGLQSMSTYKLGCLTSPEGLGGLIGSLNLCME